jgi:methylase of polypeptide subunit release factors
MTDTPRLHWTDDGTEHQALWRSEAAVPPPRRVVMADDRMSADVAYKLACEGTGLLWCGDFQNARHLLQALMRRMDRKAPKPPAAPPTPAQAFHLHRKQQGQRASILGMILIPFDADHRIPLRRAPDMMAACAEAYGDSSEPYVASLRELLGLVGAHEWRKKGVKIPAIKGHIHAHYGVFSPVRGEYIDLVAQAPLPETKLAFDIGTGTGVLAAVLAKRGIRRVVATDMSDRALACAQDNITRLKLLAQVEVQKHDLFPKGQAMLVVCNPPWVPAKPSSPIEYAVYDPDSRMLKGFLQGLKAHLLPGGEGWLILSDLAEHLGLRSRDELLGWIADAGLEVKGRLDAHPHHPKVMDESDPLHRARAAEVTSLWQLVARAA